jgi:hypothetical protein
MPIYEGKANVVDTIADANAIVRLIGATLSGQSDEWLGEGHDLWLECSTSNGARTDLLLRTMSQAA